MAGHRDELERQQQQPAADVTLDGRDFQPGPSPSMWAAPGALGPAMLRRKLRRRLAQRSAGGDGVASDAPEAVAAASSSSGRPLPDGLRSRFEGSLGVGLGGVRVHDSATSARAAEAVGAHAFTTGQDIHFGAGQLDTSSRAGQHLLAHEVAHTVQQSRGGDGSAQYQLEVGAPDDPLEHQADRAADAMVDGRAAEVGGSGGAISRRIQRACDDGAVPGGGSFAAAPGVAPASAGQDPGQGADTAAAKAPEAPATQGAPPRVEGEGAKGGPLSEDKALSVLDAAFKGYRTVSKGTVKLLAQADFQVAYEKIYGKTDYSWDKWVKPKFGNLNGFAHDNVNYINKATANTGTVPHEMLHNNAAADWRPFVGNEFDEGSTDYLKQHALKKAGLSSPNSYEAQLGVVNAFLATGVSDDQFFTAYLKGDAKTIVGKWVDDHCAGTWADVKAATQAKDFAKAKVKLGLKPAAKPAGKTDAALNDLGPGGTAPPSDTAVV